MVAARELVAVALPAGQGFLAALTTAWEGGPALLPLHPALPDRERARLLAELRPARLIDASGTHELAGGAPVDADVTAVVVTSGSTGASRGVELTRAALEHSARAGLARLRATREQRWLCCLPPSSVGGLQVLIRSLVLGIEPVMLERFDAAAVAAADAQAVSLVPTMLTRVDTSRFRHVLLGGASPPRVLPANVTVTYGMTETCGGCVYDGVPLDGVEVDLTQGRIRIRGPVLARGALPIEDGWLVTNDLGRWDAQGRLDVLGRADDMIISGGANVFPARVAAAVAGHPGIAEAAVIGRPDPQWGERVVAVVVPGAAPPDLPALRAFLAESLAPHELPRELVLVDHLPLLPNGKVDRRSIGCDAIRSASP